MHIQKAKSHHVADECLALAVEIYLRCVHDGTRMPPDCEVPPPILALVNQDKKLAVRTLCLAIYQISRPNGMQAQMLRDLMTDHIYAQLPIWALIQESFHELRTDKQNSPWVTQLDVLNLLRSLMPVMLDLVDPPMLDIVPDVKDDGPKLRLA